MFSFKVQVNGQIAEGPMMGAGDVSLLQKLFPDNPVWGCKKSELGNQMYPTVQEMKALYNAILSFSAEHEISAKVFITGNTTGGGTLVTSSATALFKRLIEFCEEKLGFRKSKKMQIALTRKEKQEAAKLANKARRVRKGALVVTTNHSTYDIGPSDEQGRRRIVRRGRPLSDITSGQIIFLRKGRGMQFFLDGDPEEYKSSTVQSIRSVI